MHNFFICWWNFEGFFLDVLIQDLPQLAQSLKHMDALSSVLIGRLDNPKVASNEVALGEDDSDGVSLVLQLVYVSFFERVFDHLPLYLLEVFNLASFNHFLL